MHAYYALGVRFLPVALLLVALEIGWYLLIQKRAYPWHETLASLSLQVMRLPARILAPTVLAPIAFFLWHHRVTTVPLDNASGFLLLFLGEEFAYYWEHRAAHEVRWLWASHVVHHTPAHLHLASAFRLGATEALSGSWVFRLPLYFIGFNPLAVAAMGALNLCYQFWLHTDLVGRLGPIEWIFNTPSHHRVHHASNAQYLDRNYGGILIIWDRLFGTFASEDRHINIRYGLVHPFGCLNPFVIAFHEWAAMARDVARARSWRERLVQLFGSPGDSLAHAPAAPALPGDRVRSQIA
ncbi:MAG TPA: sterol desaturase family protein [Stellaceae bacterium]|nr:sterol desaturase family protein [Stellaceae bacterium]